MSAPAVSNSLTPSGFNVFKSFPEVLMIGELVFGGLVWILVASTKVPKPDLQGWLMFVSVFCFIVTCMLLTLYIIGVQKRSFPWAALDAIYHIAAAVFYFSVAVMEARDTKISFVHGYVYKMNIGVSLFAFLATLLYTIHAIFSALRWKSSS
ncbi:myelin and lymphocyte protein-like [Mustelus asterias]